MPQSNPYTYPKSEPSSYQGYSPPKSYYPFPSQLPTGEPLVETVTFGDAYFKAKATPATLVSDATINAYYARGVVADPFVSADETAIKDALVAQLTLANNYRKSYIDSLAAALIFQHRQFKINKELKIEAPFKYQLEDVLQVEKDSINAALLEVQRKMNSAFASYSNKLQNRVTNMLKSFEEEQELIINALGRAIVDHKLVWNVFLALRIPWLNGISLSGTGVFNQDLTLVDLRPYKTVFDDWVYDVDMEEYDRQYREIIAQNKEFYTQVLAKMNDRERA